MLYLYYKIPNLKKGALVIFLLTIIMGCKKETPQTVPILTTKTTTSITANSAVSGGDITNNGGSEITEKGICWSKNPNPTVTDNKISNGKGSEPFTSNITGLSGGTQYYVRAYAINATGTGYGSDVSFTSTATLATFTTPITSGEITDTSSIVSVTIQSNGGATITERGICWSLTDNPTINNNKIVAPISQSNQNNFYNITISKLNFESKYYIRAYAINSVGISYSSSINFTTLPKRLVDIDGNSYKTVRIGNQIWMADDLRVTKFSNGEKIPLTRTTLQKDTVIAYALNPYDTSNKIGAYYSHGVVLSKKQLAPKGYHIPTVTEFNNLIAYLGGTTAAATALKSGIVLRGSDGRLFGWGSSPYQQITNSSGFSMLQSNYYGYSSNDYPNLDAYLWCSDGKNTLKFIQGSNSLTISIWSSDIFHTIRCIKD